MQQKTHYTENIILETSFILFLSKGYKGTTITDMENATKKTRGAIFYFFKSKEEVFIKVIDKYIIETQTILNKVDLVNDMTLKNFFTSYTEGIVQTMKKLNNLSHPTLQVPNHSLAYFSLFMEAGKYYPGFDAHFAHLEAKELHIWESVLQNAVHRKEIKKINCKAYAKIFRSVFLGESFSQSIHTGLNVEKLFALYNELYNQIKID